MLPYPVINTSVKLNITHGSLFPIIGRQALLELTKWVANRSEQNKSNALGKTSERKEETADFATERANLSTYQEQGEC